MTILKTGEYTGEIIQSQQIGGSIISNTMYTSRENNSDWHNHENLHICFVYEGGKAQTKHKTTYSKKEGSVFFYHSEELHRWISPSPTSRSANIEIGYSFLKKYKLDENDIKEAVENNVSTKALILKMQKELLCLDQKNHTPLLVLLLDLVSLNKQNKYLGNPLWVLLLNELLHDQWDKVLSLKEISEYVGAHPVTISKNFRKYFHCTLGEYQRKLKIEKTIDLIKDTSLSLSEIAYYCGFTDQSHFTRNFKKLTGFLPRDYRKF